MLDILTNSSVTVVLWQKVNLTNNHLIFQNKIGVILCENNWRLIRHIIQHTALASSYWTTKKKGTVFIGPPCILFYYSAILATTSINACLVRTDFVVIFWSSFQVIRIWIFLSFRLQSPVDAPKLIVSSPCSADHYAIWIKIGSFCFQNIVLTRFVADDQTKSKHYASDHSSLAEIDILRHFRCSPRPPRTQLLYAGGIVAVS